MKTFWAFEPKNQNQTVVKGMAKLISQFSPYQNDLQVGYVVTGNESFLYTAFDVPEEERFSVYPTKLILQELKASKAQIQPKNVHIREHRTLSTTTTVDQLLKLARSQKADLLALFTHNKKGVERWILGSFAETVIHRSNIDLLLAGPKSKFPDQIQKILFASDFGEDAKKEIRRVLSLSKQIGANLTVFHAPQMMYRWALDESNPEIRAYRKTIDQTTKWIQSESEKINVRCEVVIETEFDMVDTLVFKHAKKVKADLVVVAAKAGPGLALMGGSITRKVVRNGTYPVLILKK